MNKDEIMKLVDAYADSVVHRTIVMRVRARAAVVEALEAQATEIERLTAEPVEPNNDHVICPNCVHQFRAIPVNVQRLMLDAGFEPPFTHPAPQDTLLRKAAQAVIDRWETPSWKDVPVTAKYINELRMAMNAIHEEHSPTFMGEPVCNPHLDAPHGFNRNASHDAHRYVCDCEGWVNEPVLGGIEP